MTVATFKPSQLVDSIKGSLGTSVFSQWRGQNVIRRRPEVVRNPQTDKQTRARQNLTEGSKAWSKVLSQQFRDAWKNYQQNRQTSAKDKFQSSTVPSVIPPRQSIQSGFNSFVGHNAARQAGTVNHQPEDPELLPQTQTVSPNPNGLDVTFTPEQEHIRPMTPCEGEQGTLLQQPPTGIQPPGMPKITFVGISEDGTPGTATPNVPPGLGVNGYNSPPAVTPNFVHVVVEFPPEIEGGPPVSTPTSLTPKGVIPDLDPADSPIKGAVRLWKKGPEATGAYQLASTPFLAQGETATFGSAQIGTTGGTVEYVFQNFPSPSNEASIPDPNPQSSLPPSPGLHEFQADVVNEAGQVSAPSNEMHLWLGQPQSPCPETQDVKPSEPSSPYFQPTPPAA